MVYLRVPVYYLRIDGRTVASDAYFVSKLEKPYRRILLIFPAESVGEALADSSHTENVVLLNDVGFSKWLNLMKEGYLAAKSLTLRTSSSVFRKTRLLSLVVPALRISAKHLEEVGEANNALALYSLVFGTDPLKGFERVVLMSKRFVVAKISCKGLRIESLDEDSYVNKVYRWLFEKDEDFKTEVQRLARRSRE